ncbi:MAG: PqqD family protein [Clostridia bacterium]|nr:PqqD family protein [Clostridia bacterium]
MKKKKQKSSGNYLDLRPVRAAHLRWSQDDKGLVTLDIDNKGAFNRIAQVLFRKPKVSHIHLDELGSFVWPVMDGEKTIFDIGKEVDEHFGEKAHPLYERLAKYFQILDSYHFVEWNEQK